MAAPARPSKRPQRTRSEETPQALVARAAAVADAFAELGLARALGGRGLERVRLRARADAADRRWMCGAVEGALRALYDASGLSWDGAAKRREMRSALQRFLIAEEEGAAGALAFLAYRFDLEDGEAVLYVYELFVEERMRGKGMAVALMRHAELICQEMGIQRIMLTVFKRNTAAMHLYSKKLGYAPCPLYMRFYLWTRRFAL